MNFARILLSIVVFFLVLVFWILWKTRLLRKGFRQLREKDFTGAVETFEKVLKQNQPRLNNYVNLSAALIAAERYAEALAVLDDAIEAGLIDPPEKIETADLSEAIYLSNRGVALGKLDRCQEGLDCLETSLRNLPIENPMYPLCLLNYARIYARQGEPKAALRVLEEYDRWFESHEIADPQQVETIEEVREKVMAELDAF